MFFVFQLAGEGSGQFDIGEMAFDATFDHDYGEQEVSGYGWLVAQREAAV